MTYPTNPGATAPHATTNESILGHRGLLEQNPVTCGRVGVAILVLVVLVQPEPPGSAFANTGHGFLPAVLPYYY